MNVMHRLGWICGALLLLAGSSSAHEVKCRMSAASCKRLAEIKATQEIIGEWDPRPNIGEWPKVFVQYTTRLDVSEPKEYGSYRTETQSSSGSSVP